MSRHNRPRKKPQDDIILDLNSNIYVVKHKIVSPENPLSVIIFREMGTDNEFIWFTDEPNKFGEDKAYTLKVQATGKYIIDLTIMEEKKQRTYVSA